MSELTRKRNTFSVDEELDSPFDWRHFRRAMGYIARYKGNFVKVFFISIASMLLSLLTPLLVKQVVDEYVPNGKIGAILASGAVFIGISAAVVVCNRMRSRINSVSGQNIIAGMRADLFEHLQKLPFDYYDSRPSGKILVRVVNYINSVADFLSAGVINFVNEPLSMIFVVVYSAAFVSWRLTLVMLGGMPLFIGYLLLVMKRQRKAWQAFSNKHSNMTAYIAENINGVKVTQAFTRESVNAEVMDGLLGASRKSWMRAVYFTHSMLPATMITTALVSAAIYLSGALMLGELITVGTILAMVGFSQRFWGPLQNLGALYNSLISTVAYLERIFQVLDEPVTITDREGAYPLPSIKGSIAFQRVCFSYESGVAVLDDVSFNVDAGESIALVGPTGAGKSTILSLLSRFYELAEGSITVDGHDIKDVTLASLRRQMGIMLQDTFVFSGNVIENIRYGRLDATDEECVAAARAVMADEFISGLPKGYYTPLDERGEGLSAGQKQLIAFARTLLSDPRILILDEATSSIDTHTERLIQEGIARMLVGRTSFIVAHRLSTIRNCTKIMYIDGGVIAEQGSHDELIAKRGKYYRLYMSQIQEVA